MVAASCWLLAGCVTDPSQLAAWDPSRWSGAAQEDLATAAARLRRLRTLETRAAELSAEDQQRVALQIARALPAESDATVRIQMTRTLAVLSAPGAGEGLRLALEDQRPAVRVAACQALTQHPGEASVAALSTVLKQDASIDVRLAATRALSRFRHPAAVGALSLALQDPDPALQRRGVQSLRAISDHDLGNSVSAWREYALSAADGGTDVAERNSTRR
jgi:HEAT repeat protein